MRTLLALTLLGACSGSSVTPAPLASADVSILYPAGVGFDRDDLVLPTDEGARGALLPQDDTAGRLPLDAMDTYADLRLIGVRLDPCSARGGCTSEVRAVFQPILNGPRGPFVGDGAIHVFYAVPADELLELARHLGELKAQYGADVTYPAALGTQPILTANGLRSEYAVGLRETLLDHLGADRIERITSFRHGFNDGHFWTFSIAERAGDAFMPVPIATTTLMQQTIDGSDPRMRETGGITAGSPLQLSVPALEPIVDVGRDTTAEADLAAGFAAAVELQDPHVHTSENTDCSSCHLAEGGRYVGESEHGWSSSMYGDVTYTRANHAITNLHAFGYWGPDISVMKRTAIESTMTVTQLSVMLAP